jgi:uncharacterized OsmC-like protein
MKLRKFVVAAVAAFSSLALVAPAAHASGLCYDVSVTVNGETQSQAGCIDLP